MRGVLRAAFCACALSVLSPLTVAHAEGTGESAAKAQTPSASTAGTRALPRALTPTLTTRVSPTSGLVTGDVVTLVIEAVAPAGVEVAVPEQSLAPFEPLDRRARTEPSGDRTRFVFELELLALEPGTLTVPALTLRVVGPKGELGELQVPARTVVVKALLGNEPNAEPKPATKPVAVIEDDYTLAWVLGALLFAALVSVATLFVRRLLAQRPKLAPPPPPPRPPWELALEKLELLSRQKGELIEAQRSEEFVDGVSHVLREYLGLRYGFDGLESTSDEVVRTLERLRPYKLSLSGVSLLLEQCDLAKFARATPDEAQCDDVWNGAVGLVRATTPAVEAMPQGQVS